MAQRKSTTKTASKKSTKSRSRTTTKAAKAAKASPKTRTSSGRRSASSNSKSSAGSREVTIDRRRNAGRRKEDKESASAKSDAQPPKLERRKKVNRRRQIDPTTCERDYTDDEVQFMNALDEYKRASGRMFPTCSEVLEVVRSLGYVKLTPAELAERSADPAADGADATAADTASQQPELTSAL